jgi:ABC-type Fe3+ transport system permease subunit
VVFFETDLQGQFTATAAAMVPLIIGPLVAASAYVLAVGRKRIRIQPDIPA